MGVSFDSYKTFYYVAKFRSFTEAAKALYVTQPTVTHAIQMLEKELDCILFQRSRKGVSLTPEAAMLYEHVKAACEHIFEAENALKAKKELLDGQIRIGAGETTLHFFLLPYLKQFKTLYPGVKIKVNNTSTPASLSALRAGHIDFAILVMRPDYKGAFLPRDRFSVTRLAGFQDIFIAGNDFSELSVEELKERLQKVDDQRIYVIAEAIRKGIDYDTIHEITMVDHWFIDKIAIIVEMEQALAKGPLTPELLREAKRIEFPDTVISRLTGIPAEEIKQQRYDNGIVASYKMVDTCAAEFEASTPYYYSVYGGENEAVETNARKKVLVLGSGPIRIGQGIEFDYCSVHATWAFSREGYETVIVNNNPETVSTDFDIADKLYFEPLTPEDVENVVNMEHPDGAVVQFGGQTAIKLTESLMKMGVPILGTSAENVDAAEDRELFDEILEECGIPRPSGGTVYTAEEAKAVANRLGYPVLVRPSYVLGGQGMQIAISDTEVEEFMEIINRIAQDHPILVDKYLQGKELEVDAVCDGTDILIPGIMEHIERAGVHSGDSISVYPAQTISEGVKATIAEYTRKLAKSLHVIGLINIQFIVVGEDVYVIEVNPRSSRTVPYISKVTGILIVDLATEVIIGKKIRDLGYEPGLQPEAGYVAIKMPVFSFEKIRGAEISLGPEMKSTGECLGIAKTFNEALYKAFLGAGIDLPRHKQMIITVKDADKGEAIDIARRFEKLGYIIYATRSTAAALKEAGIKARQVNKINQESPTVMDLILGHRIDLVIDTPTQGRDKSRDGFLIRRTAIETGVNCLTSLDTARALVGSLETKSNELSLIDIAKL